MQKLIQKIKDSIYPSISIVAGLEKESKSPLTFAYVGINYPKFESYWSQISLCENPQKHDIGRCFVWNIFSFLKKSPFKCDFLLVKNYSLISRFFNKLPGFKIPYWVTMELDISAPIEKLLGSERPYIQRKIRKNKLSYAIVNDKESFDDFYHNMYIPFVSTRHASAAFLYPYENLWETFSKGGLILIKKEDKTVSGVLFKFDAPGAKLHVFGIREGKWEYVKDGVLGAAYYFSIIEMKKKGLTKLNIGMSRPFFNDGVTAHKTTLEAYLVKKNENLCFWLGLLKNSIGLKDFLIDNPFVFIDEKQNFYGAIFGEIKKEELPQKLKGFAKSSCGGLCKTFFFAFNKFNVDQEKDFLNGFPLTFQSLDDVIIK